MKDTSFVCYSERYVYLSGEIKDGCLSMESEVDGGDYYYDSEKHYKLTREATEKLFSIMTLEDFISFCTENMTLGMEGLFKHYGIDYRSVTI